MPKPRTSPLAAARAMRHRFRDLSRALFLGARRALSLPQRVHSDERGAISVMSVFTLLVFTFLLGMAINVASHLDDKMRMQNSADAAAHSGGVILARGMNAVAFTNHLLCDVFAITAYLREARDRQSEKFAPEILDEWEAAAQRYSSSEFEKYQRLGSALSEKIPLERELVTAFGELNAAAAEHALPVFEETLAQELIPKFQQVLVRTIPELAQHAANDTAVRNALKASELNQYPNLPAPQPEERQRQSAVLWSARADGGSQIDQNDPLRRYLPVVDPNPNNSDYSSLPNGSEYLATATLQRQEISKHYLNEWNRDKLALFDQEANLAQLNWLWRIFTCGQLDKLLKEEYPLQNLPMMTRMPQAQVPLQMMQANGQQTEVNQNLDDDYHYLALVYRQHVKENGPGLFRNPLKNNVDAMTFAQVRLFLPVPRYALLPSTPASANQGLGGSFGFSSGFTIPPRPGSGGGQQYTARDNWPTHWDCLNQNWIVKLVPANADTVLQVLQYDPNSICNCQFDKADFNGATPRHLRQVNTH